MPTGQRPLEHVAGEPVDLDDQEPPPARSGRTSEPESPDHPVDSTLETKEEILAAHRSLALGLLGLAGCNAG